MFNVFTEKLLPCTCNDDPNLRMWANLWYLLLHTSLLPSKYTHFNGMFSYLNDDSLSPGVFATEDQYHLPTFHKLPHLQVKSGERSHTGCSLQSLHYIKLPSNRTILSTECAKERCIICSFCANFCEMGLHFHMSGLTLCKHGKL